MNLFFSKELTTDFVTFTAEESRHITSVLRMKPGEQLLITDGTGTMCSATLTEVNSKSSVAQIVERTNDYKKRPYTLHIAVAPTKNIDRYEWFLEKATEVGVDRITPLLCDHSERKIVKRDRSEKVVVGAVKQSQKAYLPLVDELTPLRDFLKSFESSKSEKYIAHCDDEASKVELRDVISQGGDYVILVGPEGDFSPAEVVLAHKAGFRSVALGASRLRTETAALYVAMAAAIKN